MSIISEQEEGVDTFARERSLVCCGADAGNVSMIVRCERKRCGTQNYGKGSCGSYCLLH